MIKEIFDKTFEHWDIQLPPESLDKRKRGEIQNDGWYIQYLFGSDQTGEYLDYYANHRMTNPRHKRIYQTGETESLPAPLESYSYDQDVPGDKERAEKEYQDHIQKVEKILKNKGFL